MTTNEEPSYSLATDRGHWIATTSNDVELVMRSKEHGELLVQDLIGLYYVWKYAGMGDVLLKVDIPAGFDLEGLPRPEIQYDLVLRRRMK